MDYKNHDLREEKWHFLTTANSVFELRFEIRSLKLHLTSNFSSVHPKNKETMMTFLFISFYDIKITIMTSYFGIRDEVIIFFFNFTRFLPIAYSHQVSATPD